MRLLGDGNRDVMREILLRHQPRTWRLAYRLTGNRPAADDLTQEAFIRLYQSAPRYRPDAGLATFLHRITVNLVIDARRSQKPAAPLADVDIPAPPSSDPLIENERAAQVSRAVLALPDRQRAAVVLHRYESLSYREIASILGTTEPAVESLIMRAYAGLRKTLADLADT